MECAGDTRFESGLDRFYTSSKVRLIRGSWLNLNTSFEREGRGWLMTGERQRIADVVWHPHSVHSVGTEEWYKQENDASTTPTCEGAIVNGMHTLWVVMAMLHEWRDSWAMKVKSSNKKECMQHDLSSYYSCLRFQKVSLTYPTTILPCLNRVKDETKIT